MPFTTSPPPACPLSSRTAHHYAVLVSAFPSSCSLSRLYMLAQLLFPLLLSSSLPLSFPLVSSPLLFSLLPARTPHCSTFPSLTRVTQQRGLIISVHTTPIPIRPRSAPAPPALLCVRSTELSLCVPSSARLETPRLAVCVRAAVRILLPSVVSLTACAH